MVSVSLDRVAPGAPHTARVTILCEDAPCPATHGGKLDLWNLIRGLHPWPHAFSFLHGKRVILRRSAVNVPDPTGLPNVPHPPYAPGTVLEADGDRLVVATGDGLLRITEIQAEGKRPMTARDFLAGHRLAAGDRVTAAP